MGSFFGDHKFTVNTQKLDLTLDANDILVSDGTLFCNESGGFEVSLTSANGASETVNSGLFLANSISQVTNRLPYDLKIERGDGTSASVTFVNGVASSVVQGTAGDAINETFQMQISFVGNTALQADTYTDELTLAIVAL